MVVGTSIAQFIKSLRVYLINCWVDEASQNITQNKIL